MLFWLFACADEGEEKQEENTVVEDVQVPVQPLFLELAQAAEQGDGGFALLTELCDDIGHRLSGSKGLDQAISWAQVKMGEYGFENIQAQPVLVPNWTRGEESLELLSPKATPTAHVGSRYVDWYPWHRGGCDRGVLF